VHLSWYRLPSTVGPLRVARADAVGHTPRLGQANGHMLHLESRGMNGTFSAGSRACRRTYYIAVGGPSKRVYLVSKFNDVSMACDPWGKYPKVALPFFAPAQLGCLLRSP
jgi:hypothetical protein